MSLLTRYRNMIGRKREREIGETAVIGTEETDIGDMGGYGVDRVMTEIEAKPSEPEPEPEPEPESKVEDIRPEQDDGRVVLDAAREVVQRLDDIDVRLGARGTETHRLVKELDGHIEASTDRTEKLVQRLDARVELQVADSKKLTEQVGQVLALAGDVAEIKQQCASMLQRIDEQVDQSQNHDDLINAAVGSAVDAAATRFAEALDRNGESLQQMRDQINSTARSVSHADERSEGVVNALRDIQGRTAGLDDAITRIGRIVQEREDKIIDLLSKTRRSMSMFAYGCTLASLLAVAIAAVAIFLN